MTVVSPVPSAGTLRERFTGDMTVREYSAKTQHDYLRTVAGFAAVLERCQARPRLRTSDASKSSSPSAA